jgi:hypothetical protein
MLSNMFFVFLVLFIDLNRRNAIGFFIQYSNQYKNYEFLNIKNVDFEFCYVSKTANSNSLTFVVKFVIQKIINKILSFFRIKLQNKECIL